MITREEKQDMWQLAVEIMDTTSGAKAMPIGAEMVQSQKGDTGHHPWLNWAIDFLNCCEGTTQRAVLNSLYCIPNSETRRRKRTPEEKKMERAFWKEVYRLNLHEYGELIQQKITA